MGKKCGMQARGNKRGIRRKKNHEKSRGKKKGRVIRGGSKQEIAETRKGCSVKAQAAGQGKVVFLENSDYPFSSHLLCRWHYSKENTNISILVVFLKASGKELKWLIYSIHFLACLRATKVQIVLGDNK